MDKLINVLSLNKLHVKVLIAFAVIIIISSTVVSYLNSKDLIKKQKNIAESYKTIQEIEELYSILLNAETARRGYFITEDKQFFENYKDAASSVDTVYTQIKKITALSHVQQAHLDTLSFYIRERFTIFEQSLKLQDSRGNSLKAQRPLFGKGVEIQENINRIFDEMINEERHEISKSEESAENSSKYSIYALVGGAASSVVLIIISFVLLIKIASRSQQKVGAYGMTVDELETLVRDRTAEISQLSLKINQRTSELDKMKASIALYEQSYRSLFDQSHDAIIVFAPDTERVLDLNTKACETYGLSREEFIGVSMKYLSKNVPQGEQNIKEVMAKGFYGFQSVHYKKDGSEMLIQVSASVINYKGSKAILSINKEITDKVFQVV